MSYFKKGKELQHTFDDHWVEDENGCHIWQRRKRWNGYGRLHVDGVETMAHRFSYKRSKGDIPPGKFVIHSCNNRLCVRPEHLRIGNNSDNMIDASRAGRYCGPHGKQKLNVENVLEIRRLADGCKITHPEIAKIFGICAGHVSRIKCRTAYKWLKEEQK